VGVGMKRVQEKVKNKHKEKKSNETETMVMKQTRANPGVFVHPAPPHKTFLYYFVRYLTTLSVSRLYSLE
jgi:hypothetical protein